MVSPQANKMLSSDNEVAAGDRVREEKYLFCFLWN